MAYGTLQNLTDRFGTLDITRLSNPDSPTATTPNVTVVGRVLDDATAEIDAYLGTRYTLPLASTPARLEACACDIAYYRLTSMRPRGGSLEDARNRYDEALRFLRDVAKGIASLGVDLDSSYYTPTVTIASDARLFGRATW
jgi:phage gp36-like protein